MYAIKTKNGLLNGFYANDLPTTKRLYFNESNEKLEPKFTMRNMMNCTGGYMMFDKPEEAEHYISYIINEVENSRERYELSLQGSTDKILSIVSKFSIITI